MTNFYRPPHDRSLSTDLQPKPAIRLLKKDIDRRKSIPSRIAEGARITGGPGITYWVNSSSSLGPFTSTTTLGLDTVPLVLAWHLGGIDKQGTSYGSATMITNEDTPIASGASAKISWDKDELTITVTCTNVGWPYYIVGYFYYAVYYDHPGALVTSLGL